MIVQFVVGDWSHDGHNQTDVVMVESNKNVLELEQAYEIGVSICGLDLAKNVCKEYEDSSISIEQLAKLEKCGYVVNDNNDIDMDDPAHPTIFDSTAFVNLWLFIAKLGDSELVATTTSQFPYIKVGGYGLFWT